MSRSRLFLVFALGASLCLWGCGKANVPVAPAAAAASLDPASADLIQKAREGVIASPKSAEAWGRLGQAFHSTEFLSEAAQCYRRAIELDATSVRWLHLLSLIQLADHPEEALKGLARSAELAGMQSDASRVRLMQALVERGRWEEAAEAARWLLARDPVHPMARLESARVHLARNELDLAIQTIEPSLTNRFTSRPAILLLSQIRQRQGDSVAAAELADRASRMPRPFDWPDPFLREVQGLRVDRQKAIDRVNDLLIQGRIKEAEMVLAPVFTAFPNDPECLLMLGRLRLMERKCSEAEEALRRHLGFQPESINGLMQVALAILCQERWADSVAPLRQLLALKPDFGAAHYNLGYALARSGDSDGAIQSYRQALRINPGDVNTHVALAEELLLTGQNGAAATQLDRAEKLGPADLRIQKLRERLR